MGIFSTLNAANATNLTNKGTLVRPWININNIPVTTSWGLMLKTFLDSVCKKKTPTSGQTDRHRFNLLQDSADGKYPIASTLGFDKNGNVNGTVFNNTNSLHKATYLLFVRGYPLASAVKTPAYTPLNSYTGWRDEINKIRHKYWELNKSTNFGRLTTNGEREIATVFRTLSSPLATHYYNTLHKMRDIAELAFNPRELQLMFDSNDAAKPWGNENDKRITLKHYLVSKLENDYYKSWNLLGTFYPHIPGPAFPIASGVKTVNLSNTFNPGEANLYIPNDEDYKNSDKWIKGNYIKYPRIKAANNSTNKVTISGYKLENHTVYLPIRVAPDFWWKLGPKNYLYITGETDYMYCQYMTVDQNNTNKQLKSWAVLAKNNTDKKRLRLYADSGRQTYYWPNFNAGEFLFDEWLYEIKATDTHHVKVIKKTEFTDIVVTIPGGLGLNASDLLGARVLKRKKAAADGSWYYLEYTDQTSTNTRTYSGVGSSGLTMGSGLDLGTSQRKTYAAANEFSFNSFLTKVCANWNKETYFGKALTSAPKTTDTNNRAKVLNVSGKKAVDASNYWAKNRRLFELIDLNDSFGNGSNQHSNYGVMLWSLIDLMAIYVADEHKLKAFNGLYYNTSDLEMATEFEKYIALHAAWAGSGPTEFKTFVKAVNAHDYALLKQAVSNLSIRQFAKDKITEILNKPQVKNYYKDEHFNDI